MSQRGSGSECKHVFLPALDRYLNNRKRRSKSPQGHPRSENISLPVRLRNDMGADILAMEFSSQRHTTINDSIITERDVQGENGPQ